MINSKGETIRPDNIIMTIPKKILVYYTSLNACLLNLAAASNG